MLITGGYLSLSTVFLQAHTVLQINDLRHIYVKEQRGRGEISWLLSSTEDWFYNLVAVWP